jgi:hypothetical protein
MKVTRWATINIEHNSSVFSRRYCRLGKMITNTFDFETHNPAKAFDKFIRRNKPLSLRRIVSFLKWETGTTFVGNFNSLTSYPTFVHRYCGMRHYGKELIDLIDKRIKSFPNQTDYKLAERLKLTVEKTFNL